MTGWTQDELRRIGAAVELAVSTARMDGTLRRGIPIWQVVVGDAVYIRSAHGPENTWFRRAVATGTGRISSGGVQKDVTFAPAPPDVNLDVTAAYQAKYDRYGPGPVGAVTGADVARTTLRVLPRG
ncbi:MAG: DUF2255 family protein [Actinobacteria bacterium]|nr:DUF2255 family protein [Actinomycetota bacterium]